MGVYQTQKLLHSKGDNRVKEILQNGKYLQAIYSTKDNIQTISATQKTQQNNQAS